MTEFERFIAEMDGKYPGQITLTGSGQTDLAKANVPEPLREFYSLYGSAEFPFGEIYRADDDEAQAYFKDMGWFCFGFDGYFSYWLCSFERDRDGLWLTPWDHDSGTEPEAVYGNIVEFLRAVESEYAG